MRDWASVTDNYSLSTPGSVIRGSENVTNTLNTLQIQIGEVIEIVKSNNATDVGRIKVKLLNEKSDLNKNKRIKIKSSNPGLIDAIPLSNNIKTIPFLHEIVLLIKVEEGYKYFNPVNILTFIHNNVRKGISDSKDYSSEVYEPIPTDISNAIAGDYNIQQNNQNNLKLDDNSNLLNLRTNVPILRFGPGDTIFQGRFANTIRFGGGNNNTTGNIKLNLSTQYNTFVPYVENINKDSIIWMVSDESVSFDAIGPKISEKNQPPTKYDGQQILVISDRIVFGSRRNELLGFSNKSISFACNKNFSVDSNSDILFKSENNINLSSNITSINSKNIYLGSETISGTEPTVLGYKLVAILSKLLILLSSDKHIGALGASFTSVNAKQYAGLINELSNILSISTYVK